jgi:ATP-dependent RNA helicase DeaD
MRFSRGATETIHQRYWTVSGMHKLDALTRILEAETFDGMIIFVRTKNSTVELAEKLEARGFSAAAINGDPCVAFHRLHQAPGMLSYPALMCLYAYDP